MTTSLHYVEAALAAAVIIAAWLWGLVRNPVRTCPRCDGIGWIPKAQDGSWARGSKPCRRCDRCGKVTIGLVWVVRAVRGKGGSHPLARLERQPKPDLAGRQTVDAL